ncbi:hypothetical protein FO519_000075 [Halicephalobus sp. NKZ332]|nr:hypothetical protein FO519_000075 [Halicephalobus sp. NKZ332]
MDPSKILEYFLFVWICVTIPVQILIVTSIIRKFNQFKMNKSFFLFYTVNTFVDFINQFCMVFGVLFPAWGLFIPTYLKLGSALGKYLLMGSLWTRVSQGIACLLIALNRCSAVVWPFIYERIWNKKVIAISLFLLIFSGLPFTIFAATKEYSWYMNINTANLYNVNPHDVIVNNNDTLHQVQTSLTLSIPIYQGPIEAQKRKINHQLFRMASVACTMEISFTIFLAIIATVFIHPNLFYALYNSLSILYSTLNPYILLICSSFARKLVNDTLIETKMVQILVLTSIMRKFSQFKMNKSFFLFFIVNTFVDFVNQFCMVFGFLFPAWGLFIPVYLKLGSVSGKCMLLGSLWTRINQGIACLLIALNRCSAVVWPFIYERIWNKKVIAISLFLLIFSGLPFTIFAATKEYNWYLKPSIAKFYDVDPSDVNVDMNNILNDTQLLKVVWKHDDDKIAVFVWGFFVQALICFSLICCYLVMGFVLWKRSTSLTLSIPIYQGSIETQKRKINHQLFRMASVACTMEISFTVFLAVSATVADQSRMTEIARLIDYICFAFAIFTFPIQILVVSSILRNFRNFKLNKSFFLFFVVNTFIDIISISCLVLAIMFPAWGIGINWYLVTGTNLGKCLLMGSIWSRVSQGFTCLLIAVNRCSAILYPLDYERIWSPPLIFACVLIQVLAGMPMGVFFMSQDLQWKLNDAYATNPDINYTDVFLAQEPQVLKLVFKEEKAKFLVFGSGFIIQFAICILLIVCYLYMIYIFRYGSSGQLFKLAICVCTIEICFTIFTAVISTVCSKCITPNVFYTAWDFLNVVYSTSGPYVLLLFTRFLDDCLTMDALGLIDRNFLIFGALGLSVFLGVCFFVFKLALKSTTFEDRKQKEESGPNDSSEHDDAITEEPFQRDEQEHDSSPVSVESAPSDNFEKKKSKKNKQKKEEVTEDIVLETVAKELQAEPQDQVHIQEEVPVQKSSNNKKRSKRATQSQEVVDVNEDNFITRIASINEIQPEYVAFITEFIGRANSDQYEFHAVKEQVQNLQFQLREKEDHLKSRDQELNKSRKELNTLKAGLSENSRLQKDLNEQKLLCSKLQNQITEAQNTSTQRNSEVEKLRKELFDTKARLQAATTHAMESQVLKTEVAKLKAQVGTSEVDNKKVTDLEAMLKSSEEALVNARRSIASLESEKSALVDKERRICAELDELQQEISQLSSIRIEKENIAQAVGSSEEEEKLRTEIEELQKKNEACNASINKLNIELRKAFNDGYEFKQENIELKKQLEQTKDEHETLLKKLDITEKKLADFIAYHENNAPELRQLKNELRSLELEKNDLKTQLAEERELVEKLENQKSQPQSQSASNEEVENLREQKNHLYERLLTLTDAVNKAESLTAKVLKDKDNLSKDIYEEAASTLAQSLKNIEVNVPQQKIKDGDDFKKFATNIAQLVKNKVSSSVVVPQEKSSKKKHVSISENYDHEELAKLRETIHKYENIIDILEKHLALIEKANNEKNKEYENRIEALKHSELVNWSFFGGVGTHPLVYTLENEDNKLYIKCGSYSRGSNITR